MTSEPQHPHVGAINGLVSDPIDITQRDSAWAVAVIRQHVDALKEQAARWEPKTYPGPRWLRRRR